MSLISGSYSRGAGAAMLGAPEDLATDVEKALYEAGVDDERAAPDAERATRGAATRRPRGWKRSCLVAVRRLRLTADILEM